MMLFKMPTLPSPRQCLRIRAYRVAIAAIFLFSLTCHFVSVYVTDRSIFSYFYSTTTSDSAQAAEKRYLTERGPDRSKWHPIDHRIDEANTTFHRFVNAETRANSLAEAAAHYRTRRGRHPPPGFDKWYAYAQSHNAVMVESFFDRIEQDLHPYWALNATILAQQSATFEHRVRIRDGKAEMMGKVEGRVPWLEMWWKLLRDASDDMPDVDMAINYMDESRLLVPFDDMAKLIVAADKTKEKALDRPLSQIKGFYGDDSTLHVVDDMIGRGDIQENDHEPEWLGGRPYWELYRETCPHDTSGRNVSAITDFSVPVELPPAPYRPDYARDGYISNYTAASDPCIQPHLRGMHGTFIEPVSMKTSQQLIPMFAGCKLPGNNEILIPGAMYITSDSFYSGGRSHGLEWPEKTSSLVWRGVASGGRHKPDSWTHYHRHRFVQMFNGTSIAQAEEVEKKEGSEGNAKALVSALPTAPKLLQSLDQYNLPRRRDHSLGRWLQSFANVAFNNRECWDRENDHCAYLAPYYDEAPFLEMRQQYASKFIPDVDGNSYSARFRSFLFSTSLPLKGTIYAEWHDDRLFPWLHFAPYDNTFQDIYAVLDYFTRDAKGDAAAAFLAAAGKEWAESVLRHDDMLLYTWRALLEYARVSDERRDTLGYVDDLV